MTSNTRDLESERAVAYVRLVKHLLNRYSECFPTYVWTDPETSIDLMAAEIMAARHERDMALATPPAAPTGAEGEL